MQHKELQAARQAEYQGKYDGGIKALDIMEQHLGNHDYLAGDAITIADIALYGYTHVAEEAEYDLAPYPGIRAWLARVQALPGYQPMPAG